MPRLQDCNCKYVFHIATISITQALRTIICKWVCDKCAICYMFKFYNIFSHLSLLWLISDRWFELTLLQKCSDKTQLIVLHILGNMEVLEVFSQWLLSANKQRYAAQSKLADLAA